MLFAMLWLSCCTTTTVATVIANKNATYSWQLQILILFVLLCLAAQLPLYATSMIVCFGYQVGNVLAFLVA
jgi:hypothetical protein